MGLRSASVYNTVEVVVVVKEGGEGEQEGGDGGRTIVVGAWQRYVVVVLKMSSRIHFVFYRISSTQNHY